MKTTISVIKADIGSIGGHICPSARLLAAVNDHVVAHKRSGLLSDCFVSHTGDDIAILMAHRRGVNAPDVHRMAWEAFMHATELARRQGLYGAGQDLLKESFSGNVRGMGPATAEIEFEEAPLCGARVRRRRREARAARATLHGAWRRSGREARRRRMRAGRQPRGGG